jgi:hypothetical protein
VRVRADSTSAIFDETTGASTLRKGCWLLVACAVSEGRACDGHPRATRIQLFAARS